MEIDKSKCEEECMIKNHEGKMVPVCLDVCPVDAIFFKNGDLEIDLDLCIGCGSCFDICTHVAIIKD